MQHIDQEGNSHYRGGDSEYDDEEVVDTVFNDEKEKVTSWKLQLTADDKKPANLFGQPGTLGSNGSQGQRGGGLRKALDFGRDTKETRYGNNKFGISEDSDELEDLEQDVKPKKAAEPQDVK